MTFFKLLVFCIFIEGIVTYVKEIIPVEYEKYVGKILPLIIGIGVTVYYNVDMLVILKLTETTNIVNLIITGIILSRGSNYLFDILKLILTKTTELKELFNDTGVAMSYEELGSPFEFIDDDQKTENLDGYSELIGNMEDDPNYVGQNENLDE